MLPWEHAAIAYLLYSGYARWRLGELPAGWPVLVVLFASQLPDLIDKPLAWEFGILPSGRSLAHSVFFGIPLSAVVVGIASRRGEPTVGSAFAIGYLSHLATDALPMYPGASLDLGDVLWPLVGDESSSSSHEQDFLERTVYLLTRNSPSALELSPELVLGLVFPGIALLVWNLDGRPGVRKTLFLFRLPIAAVRALVPR
jgi:hypothetical protein